MENKIQEIIQKIKELEQEYRQSQGLILSEDDLKWNICRKIYDLFDHKQITMDNDILGSPIHTEIKFFDENYKLKLIPDITIINPKYLSIKHSVNFRITRNGIKYKALSSKEFEFGGSTIILELKFCKNKNGITERNVEKYKQDIEKISRIQNIVNTRSNGYNKVYGIFVIFNKTSLFVSKFQDILDINLNNLKIIYGNADAKLNY